jgi:hypothetical protein
LSAQSINKIHPFGLTFPVVSPRNAIRLLAAAAKTGRSWRELTADARQLRAPASPSAFESSPGDHATRAVLFQTRLWEPRGESVVVDINEERVAIVRALKDAFSSRFVGGLVPSQLAIAEHPDLIARAPFSMRGYASLVKRPLIGVYTRGLHDSNGFKLAEYLAASRCIVGHAPTGTLPEPLAPERNFLRFDSPSECVAQCERLLYDPGLASAIRHNNALYYRSEVEPESHLRRTLERSFIADPGST